jgi:hypothetical protein
VRISAEIEQQHLSSEIEQNPVIQSPSYVTPDLQLGGKREGKRKKTREQEEEKKNTPKSKF